MWPSFHASYDAILVETRVWFWQRLWRSLKKRKRRALQPLLIPLILLIESSQALYYRRKRMDYALLHRGGGQLLES